MSTQQAPPCLMTIPGELQNAIVDHLDCFSKLALRATSRYFGAIIPADNKIDDIDDLIALDESPFARQLAISSCGCCRRLRAPSYFPKTPIRWAVALPKQECPDCHEDFGAQMANSKPFRYVLGSNGGDLNKKCACCGRLNKVAEIQYSLCSTCVQPVMGGKQQEKIAAAEKKRYMTAPTSYHYNHHTQQTRIMS